MKCSDIREILSAAHDGEASAAEIASASAHVLGCSGCLSFAAALGPLDAVVQQQRQAVAPDLVDRVLRARRPRGELVLRVAMGLAGVVEAATTLAASLTVVPGEGAHSSHESAAFTLALAVGLVLAAIRPKYVGPYMPIAGLATILTLIWSTVDIESGEITFAHEREHAALVIGTALMAIIAARRSGNSTPWRPWPRRQVREQAGGHGGHIRLVSRVSAVLAMVAIPILIAAPAEAHAVLESSTPAPGAVLAHAPAEVSVHFDESVTLLPTSLRVFGPHGSRVDDGDVEYAAGDSSTIRVAVSDGGAGTYLLSWRVISADSHPVSGAFTYSVGRVSAAPAEAPTTTDRSVSTLLGATRWISYLGSALLLGAGLFAVLGGGRRSRTLARLGGVLLIVGAAGMVLLKGPLDAGLTLASVGRPSLLREVMGTAYGHWALVRAAVGLIGAVLVFRGPRRVQGLVLAVLAVPIALSFGESGHAVGSPFALIVDALHVIAMSAWLGGLIALVADGVPHRLEEAVRRFSTVALVSVAVLFATGVYQGWRQVRAWGALTDTTYGRELMVKVGVVLLVVALAYVSRRVLSRRSWASLRRALVVETAAIGLILGLSTTLAATQPAYSAWHPAVAANLTILGDTVEVSALPSGDREMDLHLYVFGQNGMPTDPPELDAALTLPSQQLGPLPVALTGAGPGHRVGRIAVPFTGDWTLTIRLRTSPIDEATATVSVPIH